MFTAELIHNRQKLKSTQISMNKRFILVVVCLCLEEQTTVTHNTMNLKNIMLGERSQTHKGTFIKV